MKTILEMTNVEKATALAQLLPSHMIEAALQTTFDIAIKVKTSKFENWDNPIISEQQWRNLAAHVESQLTHHKKVEHPRLFAEHYFDGYLAIFTNHCFQAHANKITTPQLYKDAIQLFYAFPVSRDIKGNTQMSDDVRREILANVYHHYVELSRTQDFYDVVSHHYTPTDDGESETIMIQNVSKLPNLFHILGELGVMLQRTDQIIFNNKKSERKSSHV